MQLDHGLAKVVVSACLVDYGLSMLNLLDRAFGCVWLIFKAVFDLARTCQGRARVCLGPKPRPGQARIWFLCVFGSKPLSRVFASLNSSV